MKLLLWTREDPASMRLADALLKLGRFPDEGASPDLRLDGDADAVLARVDGPLLSADYADRSVKAPAGASWDRALFLSKHSAASGVPAFTVHPIGNLGADATFGGRPRTLAPPDPGAMTSLLKALAAEAKPLDVAATFEATHHGPLMAIPSLFVEVGSRPQDWQSETFSLAAARAVDAGYLSGKTPEAPAPALGLGGGHYHPRQSDAARKDGTAVGHLVPAYALADLEAATLAQACESTRAKVLLLDRRKAEGPLLDRALDALEARGLRTVVLG